MGNDKRVFIDQDVAELLFRLLFSLIFLGLGSEHLFSDALIQHLMPDWMPLKRLVSFGCGMWLVAFGAMIAAGWHVRLAALGLAAFLIVVTALVHMPGVMFHAPQIPEESYWMWEILQRSNLVKNLCLLGVCFHLLYHEPGKYSLTARLAEKKPN